ncbi:AAA family ATPase [Candidatus Woesearchaeota archaeon]|nr:AAA family ATPase [Candidatus Woesearchaeota archaeon]
MENKIICVSGLTGSGKSVVSDWLVNKGFGFFRFGQITLDIVKERGLAPTEENERPIREEVRKKHGMGAYAILNMPKIEMLLKEGHVVGDGLYSWAEYKILKEKYGDRFVMISVYAPPKMRYERLSSRELKSEDTELRNRPATWTQAEARDYAEIENIEKAGPIAMADHTIMNVTDIASVHKQCEDILNDLGIQ